MTKSFTNLEQSKKLAEILPLKSADQTWVRIAIAGVNLDVPEELQYIHNGDMSTHYYRGISIPCWSLAALLEQFEDAAGLARDHGLWFCYDNRKSYCTKHYYNPIDACYEMILKLQELKML